MGMTLWDKVITSHNELYGSATGLLKSISVVRSSVPQTMASLPFHSLGQREQLQASPLHTPKHPAARHPFLPQAPLPAPDLHLLCDASKPFSGPTIIPGPRLLLCPAYPHN